MQKGSLFCSPFPALTVCRLFDDSHSDRWEVIVLWRYDLLCLTVGAGKDLCRCFFTLRVWVKFTCWNGLLECLPCFKLWHDYFLRAGDIHSTRGLVNFESPWPIFKVVVPGNGHEAAAPLLSRSLVIGAPASEKIVSWVVNQSGMCQNNDPRACVLLLLAHHSSPAIWTNPKLFNSALPKVLSSLSQAAPRMESGGENPATGSPRWLYRAPPAQKVQPPLGALGLVWLGRAGPGPEILQDLRALTWWHIQELSSLSPKADQTPGIWQQSGSQRPERNIGGHSFYSSN